MLTSRTLLATSSPARSSIAATLQSGARQSSVTGSALARIAATMAPTPSSSGAGAASPGGAASAQLPERFDGCHYLVASIVDYQICLGATWFVGHSMSTFTTMLVFDRTANHHGRDNLYYNQNTVAVRCDDGRMDPSRDEPANATCPEQAASHRR
mmetsp:Transcript_72722/g.235299  ORF Transcript_72722/g.235299 Transcript_72722/m.235299 type:complete len:155 (+) Transcript_72722:609-1073(+)